ncbi:MAG: HCP-like protein, partial [Verrucomicrobiales bacterium]|nr:HCP-like protein [Verrucomicrobiales bacterium]
PPALKHSPAAIAVMDAVAKNDPATAFKAATDGHALGDPACTYLLGQMHELGRGVPRVDLPQAFAFYEQSAKLGVPEALSATARCLESGVGTAADPQKSMFYWQMAAEAGDPPALGRMGQAEMEGHLRPANPEAALPWLEKAAAAKDPTGMWLLSKCYDAGLAGLTPSIEKAVGLCSQAAFAGQPEAMQRMGEFYATGRGMPNDPVAAIGWFRLAADYDSLPACASLALAYLNGTGCRQNDSAALDFASRAAQGGLPRGYYLLGRIYEEGLGVPPDGILGMCFHLRALEKGIGESKTAVARLRAALKPEATVQAEKLAALAIPELRVAVRERVNAGKH